MALVKSTKIHVLVQYLKLQANLAQQLFVFNQI
jgi:hypothetical protein